MIKLLVLVVVLGLVAYVVSRAMGSGRGHGVRRRSYLVELVRRCHGDEELAFRLLQAQKKKRPGISDEQAARRAIDSLNRDRR